MRNSQPVTAYLDYAAEQLRLLRSQNPAEVERAGQRLSDGDPLWQACLDAGWTIAELDEIYERRFGFRVNRG